MSVDIGEDFFGLVTSKPASSGGGVKNVAALQAAASKLATAAQNATSVSSKILTRKKRAKKQTAAVNKAAAAIKKISSSLASAAKKHGKNAADAKTWAAKSSSTAVSGLTLARVLPNQPVAPKAPPKAPVQLTTSPSSIPTPPPPPNPSASSSATTTSTPAAAPSYNMQLNLAVSDANATAQGLARAAQNVTDGNDLSTLAGTITDLVNGLSASSDPNAINLSNSANDLINRCATYAAWVAALPPVAAPQFQANGMPVYNANPANWTGTPPPEDAGDLENACNAWINQATPLVNAASAGGNMWSPSTAYTAGTQVSNTDQYGNANLYTCTTGGTSAASGNGPAGTGTGITDGSCVWSYAGVATGTNAAIAAAAAAAQGMPMQWTPYTAYPAGTVVSNANSAYGVQSQFTPYVQSGMQVVYTAINSGRSGAPPGPTATYGTVTDGTMQWSASMQQSAYPPAGYGGYDSGQGGGYGGGGGDFGDQGDAGYGGGDGSGSGDPFASQDAGGGDDGSDSLPQYADSGADVAAQMNQDMGDDGMGLPSDYQDLDSTDDSLQGLYSTYNPNSLSYAQNQAMLSPSQLAQIAASQQNLLAAQQALQQFRATPTGPIATSQFQLAPSASYADRLAAAQAALAQSLSSPDGSGDGSGDQFLQGAEPMSKLEISEQALEPMSATNQDMKTALTKAFDDAIIEMAARDVVEKEIAAETDPMEILGFDGDHLMCGRDIMGAAPVRPATPTTRTVWRQLPTRSGNAVLSQTPVKPKTGDHKASIKNARDIAKRAASVATKLQTALKRAGTKIRGVASAYHAPSLPTTVAPHQRKKLTGAQIQKIADLAAKAAKGLSKQADTHEKHYNSAMSANKQGAAKVRSVTGASTSVRGYGSDGGAYDRAVCTVLGNDAIVRSILGQVSYSAFTPATGSVSTSPIPFASSASTMPYAAPSPYGTPAQYGSGAPPDPNNPGYLVDGTPDPNYSSMTTSTSSVDPSSVLSDPNAGQGPIPTISDAHNANLNASQTDPGPTTDNTQYSALPQGAIIFKWVPDPGDSHGIGSFNAMVKDNGDGLFWDNANKRWGGQEGGWQGLASDKMGFKGTSWQDANAFSIAHGWGPLIGDPKSTASVPALKGLRYDSGSDTPDGSTGQFFWFYGGAPQSEQGAVDQLTLQQMITDWQTAVTAAQTDAATQAAQDELNQEQAAQMAQQQAQEDAAMSRQQQQESTQASHDADLQNIADQTAAARQAVADDAQQKANAAQALIDQAAAAQQADIDQKAADAAADAARKDEESRQQIDIQRAAAGLPPLYGTPSDQGGGQDDGSGVTDFNQVMEAPDNEGGVDSMMDSGDDVTDEFSGLAGLKRRLGVASY